MEKSLNQSGWQREWRTKLELKKQLGKDLKLEKLDTEWKKYRQERNKWTLKVRQAKVAFDRKLCEDIKKNFWSLVRSKATLKENVFRVKNDGGGITKSDKETANEFYKAFQSVFVIENLTELPNFDIPYHGPVIENIDVTVDEVEKQLKTINEN